MTAGTEGLAAWPPAAVATVAAALVTTGLTLTAATVGGVWAVVRWRRDVAREERDRYWSRLTWALDLMSSEDVGRSDLGFLLAEAMYDMQKVPSGEEPGGKVLEEIFEQKRRTT
jgi:hypothetical protein